MKLSPCGLVSAILCLAAYYPWVVEAQSSDKVLLPSSLASEAEDDESERSHLRRRRRLQDATNCETFPENSYFHIIARHSGMSLNVFGASNADNANIVQWPITGGTNDNWKLVPTSNGYYSLVNQKSGKAINVAGRSQENGAQVLQWPVSGSTNDDWCFQEAGDDSGFYYITARHSGKVLDVNKNSMQSGANVHQWVKKGGANQQWSLQTLTGLTGSPCAELTGTGDYAYHITARHSGMALNVDNASKENGANIIQMPLSDATNDNWSLQPRTNNHYSIVNENSGQSINVSGRSLLNGGYVVQWPISPGQNDDWCFQATGDGYYYIKARHSGLVLDVFGARKNAGADVHQWPRKNGPNQQWKLTLVESVTPRTGKDCIQMPIGNTYHITARHSGKALNVDKRSKLNGANIIQYFVTGQTNDNWRLAATDNNYFHIINENSQLAINIEGESTANGGNAEQQRATADSTSDDWCFLDAGAGYYHIQARHSGKVLAVAGDSTLDTANVEQTDLVTGRQSQHWKLDAIADPSPIWDGPYDLTIVPAAAANLPDGKILLWSASAKFQFVGGAGKTHTVVFDPETLTSTETLVVDTNHDMFCPGTAVLPDGEILITGGNNAAATSSFNPATNTWRTEDTMNIARGYHSMTVLADGNVLTLGGSWTAGRGGKTGELFDFATRTWRTLSGIPAVGSINTNDARGVYRSDNHMWLFTAPNGEVFHAGPARQMHWINASGATGSVRDSIIRGDDTDAMNGNAVMYDIGKILTIGGAANYDNGPGSNRAYIIDINNANAVTVERTGNMAYPRTLSSSVVLPSGEVVVMGGMPVTFIFSDQDAHLMTEIWDPTTGLFTEIGNMIVPRTYHSEALLLKDGRVLIAGGGLCGGSSCPVNHPDLEILNPPYLVNVDGSVKTRPIIQSAPDTAPVGSTFTVKMNTAAQHTFAMMRTGAATHAVNNDMRRIPLTAVNTGNGDFRLTVPGSSAVALPGNYFLFAMNVAGVPSVAATVSVELS